MKRGLITGAVFIAALFISSCSTQQSGFVIAEFGQEQITYDELKDAYNKNLTVDQKTNPDSVDNLKEFADLYVNYRMKLRDAHIRGYENDPDLVKEIDDYTKTVGVPYIEERYIIEPGVKELYERRKTEKRISHILIRTDTVSVDEARKQAKDLMERIKNGESFEELAFEYSEDEFSRRDSGDIYWLTAGQTVPEFDEVIAQTGKGEVYPEPVRTKFGFHIMKVTDVQPRKYEVRAQHILCSFKQGGIVDSAKALETIKLVQQKLKDGESFEALAKEYSDDKTSAANGGDLGNFQRRMMVKPFDQAVFNLEEGEISDIVETRFGYHLIKLNEVKDYPPYEKVKEELKNIYKRSAYQSDRQRYLESLKKEFNYTVNENVWENVTRGNIKVKFGDDYWESDLKEAYGDSLLFSINGKEFTVNDAMKELGDDQNYSSQPMVQNKVDKGFNEVAEKYLVIEKAYELRSGDTEFAELMNDYKNGLYIFEIQEDEIWNRVEIDSSALKDIYEKNKEDFMWPDRVSYYSIYRLDSASAASELEKIKSGNFSFEQIMLRSSSNPRLGKHSGVKELQIVESNSVAQVANSLEKPNDISDVFKAGNGWYIVQLIKKIPPEQKSFEEAKTEVIGLYQEKETKKLEDEYLQRLKRTYEPEIYYDRLSEASAKSK